MKNYKMKKNPKPMKDRVNEGLILEFLSWQTHFSYLYNPFEMWMLFSKALNLINNIHSLLIK